MLNSSLEFLDLIGASAPNVMSSDRILTLYTRIFLISTLCKLLEMLTTIILLNSNCIYILTRWPNCPQRTFQSRERGLSPVHSGKLSGKLCLYLDVFCCCSFLCQSESSLLQQELSQHSAVQRKVWTLGFNLGTQWRGTRNVARLNKSTKTLQRSL